MSAIFWLSYGVLWLVLVVLVILVILLYRQFGLMIMPGGSRVSHGGLTLGARAPAVLLRFDGERDLAYDWSATLTGRTVKASFALFALPACPLCAQLLQDQNELARVAGRYPDVQFIWVQGEREHAHDVSIPGGWTLARSLNSAAHDTMEVPGSPFAYFIAADSHILAKGLVNRPSDIDELIAGAPAGIITADKSGSLPVHQILPASMEG